MAEVNLEQPASQPASSIKPILIVFGILAIVGVSAFAGYMYGKSSQVAPRTEDAVTPPTEEAKEELPAADQTVDWSVYELPQLKLGFKMPLQLNPSEELNFTTSHSDLYWTDSPSNLLRFSATSVKSTFEGGFSYLYGCVGYKKSGTVYKFLTYTNAEVDMTSGLTEEIINQNKVKYLIVKNDPNQVIEGMPPIGITEKGYIAAIINTNNAEYPALVVQMKLTDVNTENVFNQILSTFKFIDSSDEMTGWKTYTNDDLAFKYPADWVISNTSPTIKGINPNVTLIIVQDSTLMNECMKRDTTANTEEYVLIKFSSVNGIPACSDESLSSREAWVVQREDSYGPGVSYIYSADDNPEAEILLGKLLSTFRFK